MLPEIESVLNGLKDYNDIGGDVVGLAYVKRIVEDHQGLITVESEKGKGSTFIIKLPLIS